MRNHLVRWHEKYGRRGLVVIEIDGGRHEQLELVRKCVAERGTEHYVLWDAENRNHERYGVQAWPSAYLVGTNGRVIWEGNPARVIRRPTALQDLEQLLERELLESAR